MCFIFHLQQDLASVDDDNSLLGKLQKLHISVTEHYLFSVFENSDDKTSLIYYRAQVEDGFLL